MKVLQILPELHVGGVETGTVDLAKYLIAHGHEALVVSHGGELVAEVEKAGARHYTLPVHKKSLWSMIKCAKAVHAIILDEKVDIVHARSRVPGWIAFFACRHTDAQFITTCHGYYSRHLFSRVMGWAKIIIVASQVIGRHMIDDFGVPAENIRRIPRSVDLTKFNIPRSASKGKSEFVVTIIGRITPLKGHAYFLKAMAQVVRSLPYVKVWIVGDAPKKKEIYREQLEVLVRRLGIADYVDFLGNRRDIPQLLSMTDVLVLSTVTEEAFGRVILEAQAARVPVVATRVGGVIEIVEHNKTGLLVTPKDTDEMAKAVLRLLKDKNFARRLADAGRTSVETHFTLDRMAGETLQAYQELLASSHILVIKMSALGDVVLATPSLKAIREKFPHARIHCLVGAASRQVLQRCPYIDELMVYDPQGKDKGALGLLRFAKKVRRYQFDKVIDLQNNHRSHMLSFLCFPRESYGYNNGKFGFLLSRRIKNDRARISPVEHQFRVLKMLGIEYRSDARLELWPSAQDKAYVKSLFDAEWLGNKRNIVGIHITASKKWKTKNWPPAHIAQLCDMLSSDNIRVVITGTEQDQQAARELLTLTRAKPANLVGKTDVMQLAAVIKRCRVFVTPDSSPMHIAAAMEVPFVALFGPTDCLRHLPPSERSAVISKEVACAPCYSQRCETTRHDCMKTITPEEVEREVKKLMAPA